VEINVRSQRVYTAGAEESTSLSRVQLSLRLRPPPLRLCPRDPGFGSWTPASLRQALDIHRALVAFVILIDQPKTPKSGSSKGGEFYVSLIPLLPGLQIRITVDSKSGFTSGTANSRHAPLFAMNISNTSPFMAKILPAIEQIVYDSIRTTTSLLIPGGILYFAIYSHRMRFSTLYTTLTFLSLAVFAVTPTLAPISCGPIKCVQNFGGGSH
jgi:hypothetical protein